MQFDKLLDFSCTPILITQIISYSVLGYFTFRSYKVIRIGLKEEHSEQGSLPVLAFAYMGFTLLFTISFISQFSIIYDINTKALENSIKITDDISDYLFLFKTFIISILLAFTFNFSKSFFTMNSLEFGIIVGKKYGSVFHDKIGKSLKFDIFIRFIIALLFVKLEHTLSESHDLLSDNGLSFFKTIGYMAFFLYASTIIWIFTFRSKTKRSFSKITELEAKQKNETDISKKNKIGELVKNIKAINKLFTSGWFVFSLLQYISGFILSIFMIIIGTSHSLRKYNVIGNGISGLVVLFASLVIVSIVVNAIKEWK